MRRRSAGLSLGSTVAGRYRLESKLGEGGMAEVFEAIDLATDRTVAVKVLHAHIATNSEAVERTKREGQVLSELNNPAIVNVETWGELDDGTVFLVMELLTGETLGARMARGPLDPGELAPLVAGMCAGLHAAHTRGIVHRDLKPENIFLQPTLHGTQVKLLDFGISKVYGGEKLTQTGEVLGTPRYMSPEQLGAEPDIDARVDVYALGIIIYEALAGSPPFLAHTPTELIVAILNGKIVPLRSARPDVPEAVESVVMRAMSKVRAARFDTAMAFAEAYIDAVGGPAAVRRQQRRGMATQAFGGMRHEPVEVPKTRPPPASAASDEVAGNLKIGTFSGLSPLANEPGARPGASTSLMGMSPGGSVPDSPGAPLGERFEEHVGTRRPLGGGASKSAHAAPVSPTPVSTRRKIPATNSPEDPDASPMFPQTQATPAGMGDQPLPQSAPPPREARGEARRVHSTAVMDSGSLSGAAELSMRGASPAPIALTPVTGRRRARVMLVLAALLAGAASAGAMILALEWYETHDEPVDVPSEADPAAPDPDPVGDSVEPATPVEAVDEPPAGIEPPEAVEAPDTPPSSEPDVTSASANTRRRSGRSSPTPSGAVTPAPDPTSPTAMLRSARTALREGNPNECIAILDRAIRTGAPAISLRRRADCYEAAGRRADAIRDYQRFCRLVPDHPSVSEVRSVLDGWGRTCP